MRAGREKNILCENKNENMLREKKYKSYHNMYSLKAVWKQQLFREDKENRET